MSTVAEQLAEAIERKVELTDALESTQAEIEAVLKPYLKDWFQAVRAYGPGRFGSVPCHPSDYAFDSVGRVEGEEVYWFGHDCRDHGYDLPDTEAVCMPVAFVENQEAVIHDMRVAYEKRHRKDQDRRLAEARKEVARLEAEAERKG